MCQILIISHNSPRFEKLNICNICIVYYITNDPNSWISKFITSLFTKLEVFFLKHHFLRKKEMLFSFDWSLQRRWCEKLFGKLPGKMDFSRKMASFSSKLCQERKALLTFLWIFSTKFMSTLKSIHEEQRQICSKTCCSHSFLYHLLLT